MGGMRSTWVIGPRKVTGRFGKNKGPVVEQYVCKVWVPK